MMKTSRPRDSFWVRGFRRVVGALFALAWFAAWASAWATACWAEHPAARSKPNIVLLLADDQRPDTIAALGNRHIHTPALNRLVERGTTFRQAHIMGGLQPAICSPSRAMLMSGRSLFHVDEKLASDPLLPAVLAGSGYETFGTGKWHNGPPSYARAFEQGDNIFFGGMTDPRKAPLSHFDPSGKYPAKERFVGQGYATELFADAAIDFIKAEHQKPFFCYVAFTVPHDPRIPPGDYASMYAAEQPPAPENFLPAHPFDNGELKIRDELLAPFPRTVDDTRRQLAEYYGMISHLDAQIGRILAALDEKKLAENTIIVFAADNGLAIGSHGLFGKQNLYEHSMGVPLIVAGPGVAANRRSDALCYLFDLYPTLCDLAGATVPAEVEGRSLAPILRGESGSGRKELYAAYRGVQRSVRVENLKLIWYPKIDRVQLFDLAADPFERHDLASDPARKDDIQRMRRAMANEARTLDDPLVIGGS